MTNIPNMSNLPGSSPESQVKMPAMFLMIVGAIGAVGVIFGMLFSLLGIGVGAMQGREGMLTMGQGALGLLMRIVILCLHGLIIFGGFKMSKLQSYNLAITAAIISCVPVCSPCCILGIPFGIWALVVLLKPEVKAAFLNGPGGFPTV